MKYRNYLTNLSTVFKNRFDQISSHYNFDNGDEFEIALCNILREVLPQKFGICRGFVVQGDGTSAGDDIIIFDPYRFPALRLIQSKEFAIKQDIPIEAVYCYIEAKYTIHINGDASDGQSLSKACSQVRNVKNLQRSPRQHGTLHPYFENSSPREINGWPTIQNPIYGAVIALNVKDEKRNANLDCVGVAKLIKSQIMTIQNPVPDMIILGDSNLLVPYVGGEVRSPFFIKGYTSSLGLMESKHLAFATGICMLLYALDFIQLGRMPWETIINEAFIRNE